VEGKGVMSSISDVFTELLYGEGIWFGLLILLAIIIGISAKTKYGGLFCLPITVFLGIDYLGQGETYHLWGAIIMFITSVFLILNIAKQRGES